MDSMGDNGQALSALSLADIDTTINGEPRILDLRLAEVLGFSQGRDIRKLIERHREALERLGEVCATMAQTSRKGGRPATEFWLTKKQAICITTKAETDRATDITVAVVELFDAAPGPPLRPARPVRRSAPAAAPPDPRAERRSRRRPPPRPAARAAPRGFLPDARRQGPQRRPEGAEGRDRSHPLPPRRRRRHPGTRSPHSAPNPRRPIRRRALRRRSGGPGMRTILVVQGKGGGPKTATVRNRAAAGSRAGLCPAVVGGRDPG